MSHHFLFRTHATKNIIEGAVTIRRASRKHCTASARGSYFGDDISRSRASRFKLKDHLPQHPRLASTIGQRDRPDSSPSLSPSLSVNIEEEVLSKARIIIQSSTVPDTIKVEELLQACESFARLISEKIQPVRQTTTYQNKAASNLLSLGEIQDGPRTKNVRQTTTNQNKPASNLLSLEEIQDGPEAKNAAAQLLSSTAYEIITDPKIYVTPKLLSAYVNIQSQLGRPRSLPEVFQLYASKPLPKPKTKPMEFTAPNPNKPTAHIPLSVADTALNAAIKIKDLPLCFDIINYSVCARAFQYHKFLRRAFVPISGAVLAPFAVYKLASELSGHLSNMDAAVATEVLFAGILAYVGFTATIGVVAVTTSNDQMDRVTWASGTPLRERWMREEERMLIDRVAGAWGFQQRSRRGEEEGPDWEALREWIGMKGMILDCTELMDGME
ncbi:MAG: hypothetical protein Q9221_000674 [Calogaya cf. arnoldii]